MVKATNLSDPAWQAAATDEQIARTIKLGKGAMPAFALPDGTIANLVRLVRMMNSARLDAPNGAAPSPSAGHGPVLTPSAPPPSVSAPKRAAPGPSPAAPAPVTP
jgi:hypothetical protein